LFASLAVSIFIVSSTNALPEPHHNAVHRNEVMRRSPGPHHVAAHRFEVLRRSPEPHHNAVHRNEVMRRDSSPAAAPADVNKRGPRRPRGLRPRGGNGLNEAFGFNELYDNYNN
ncbi:hypothetical protein H4219_005500, partial [Mycoemilia scoparia]